MWLLFTCSLLAAVGPVPACAKLAQGGKELKALAKEHGVLLRADLRRASSGAASAGRGLFATEDVAEGEEVISVPLALCLVHHHTAADAQPSITTVPCEPPPPRV